jgi:hypothetical protein
MIIAVTMTMEVVKTCRKRRYLIRRNVIASNKPRLLLGLAFKIFILIIIVLCMVNSCCRKCVSRQSTVLDFFSENPVLSHTKHNV